MILKIKKFPWVESANDYAKKIGSSNRDCLGNIIVALKQTKGRGQFGRIWSSKENNLYFSAIFPPVEDNLVCQLSYLICVAIGESIRHFIGDLVDVSYKIPNDIFVGDLKISGILIERLNQVTVIGIGVNTSECPQNIPAICMGHYKKIDNDKVLSKILINLCFYWNLWQEKGFADIKNMWIQNSRQIGKQIIDSNGCKVILSGITDNGLLILNYEDGSQVVRHFL
jgi:BirA family biotin operon repressor/biotin-[acetyl-CoA-carboxylase] ligase